MKIRLDKLPMSYREKVSWLSLFAIVVTFGPYLTLVALDPPSAPMPDLRALTAFGVTVVVQMFILGGGHVVLRLRSPGDSRIPADERDRAIARRSVSAAYYVLMTGVILVGCVMPFESDGWKLINAAIFAIVLAELAHYGIAVWCYRRGWND